ncbi:MAG: twin-arginine translocation signal domain-containing protein [Bacteroidetes bacterium]|nr:twin-arginine translocation signal domain-containing protein [Bacteroidota bacterium]
MKTTDQPTPNQRRDFLKQIATGAAVLGAGSLLSAPLQSSAAGHLASDVSEADAWFDKVKGKHKIVFDVIEPKGIFPFAWPKIFLATNGATGTAEKDCGVVVILRHNGIPYAMNNDLWAKYKFGEMFKVMGEDGKTPATSNPFWQPKPMTIPGVGDVNIGINDLQESGVKFCVCDMALTVYSAVTAMGMKQDPATIKKEWLAGLLPGVQPVPSGVWAVGRAQEHGCAYCFVG